ncbi:bifunctional DNA primase/polymerase [Streptomyces sp. NBC_00047]|uniref:bifunctional DNA primase/polymerase n=1 Tax=Streptomyces sp. NBC_00047 TaxID=2975627 RepID=UPI00224CE72A|nr:bifunctional DNA primase/polymerase [Streptomyces sp. NBC_00047]MCX5607897.1 bifunctional DNA primase/polymerase [Streptomyces sp. NBC_00047]
MTQPTPIPRDGRASSLLRAALATAGQGWPVIPLRPGSKVSALHGETHCPRTGQCTGGHAKPEQRATTDPDLIHAAWAVAAFNVGLATGPAGLVVIDLDAPKLSDPPGTLHGREVLHSLCAALGETLPDTHTVATPSGGLHLYFTAPPGTRLRSTQDILGRHIDTRAWGGYVVAPGSTTPAGRYEITDDRPPALLPAWVHARLTTPPRIKAAPLHPSTTGAPAGRRAAYVAAALRNERQNVASAPEGGRNKALVRAARALGRLIASGDLDRGEVEEALSWGAEAADLKPYEYRSAITSALNWSIANNPATRATP